MDIRKITLYAALIFIVYSLWISWQHDYPPIKNQSSYPNKNLSQTPSAHSGLMPTVQPQGSQEEPKGVKPLLRTEPASVIDVQTDVLKIKMDTAQGDIILAELLAYPVSVEEKDKPFTLLDKDADKRYVANSNILIHESGATKEVDFDFKAPAQQYRLEPNQERFEVVLEGTDNSGLVVKKIFTFTRGSYVVDLRYELANKGDKTWQGYMNTQILRTDPKVQSSVFGVSAYTGASFGNPGHSKYQKVSFSDMVKSNLQTDVLGGWIAMQEHYFLTAWIPPAQEKSVFYTRSMNNNYTIGSVSNSISVQPEQTINLNAKLYMGPENTEVLAGLAPGLDMTVDYGFFWFVSAPLFKIMSAINSILGNWGWTIVLVTLLIKALFYRLSARSYRSMAGMRKIQPKLLALKERFGDDKAKLSQATMELYRQEKVNPLGGCLPILVQIPVFIGLYWVLLESVEFRQAPFILWIRDLSVMDPYHVLPLIMGGTMLIQQKLNPAPPDPVQAKMMMLLPLVFTALFWSFPAGLVLYWIVNNTLSILQQWYITRKYGSADSTPKKTKKLAVAK